MELFKAICNYILVISFSRQWSSNNGYDFRVVENRKLAAYLGECRSQGIDFFPMVAESLCGWSDDAISIIQRVGHMLGQRLGVSLHITIQQLFQNLSVTLWRGNATLQLLRRRHPGPLALDFHF